MINKSHEIVNDSDSDDDLPPGWEKLLNENGRIYYACHLLQKTQWEHPVSGRRNKLLKDLPLGWVKDVCPVSGKDIYFNTIDKRKTFIDPRIAFVIEDSSEKPGKPKINPGITAMQVLQGYDLSKKNAVITGANSGIGYETARALALHGCCVIILGRNLTKCHKAMEQIQKEEINVKFRIIYCDLCDLISVREAANTLIESKIIIDILILNAGIFSPNFQLTIDGYESTFQTNYLANFYLLKLLRPSISASPRACRLVLVAAESHRFTDINENTICEALLSANKSSYRSIISFNVSKMCLVMLGIGVERLWSHQGFRTFVVHPGNMVNTNISRHWWVWKVLYLVCRPFAVNQQQAASAVVYCAASKELNDYVGGYFIGCSQAAPSKEAEDEKTVDLLWTISDKMVYRALSREESV